MACQCNCCKGACCYDEGGTPTCTEETCEDCEGLDGLWQGAGTTCTGAGSDECPCDPPADHTDCEKCVDASAAGRCGEGQTCCSGICGEEACVCVPVTGACGSGEYQCEPEEDPPQAGSFPCDTSLPPNPLTGNTVCSGGTPTQVTITVSGVTCNSGDAGTDTEVEGLINASYVVDLNCVNTNVASYTVGGFTVTVSVDFDDSVAPGGQQAELSISGVSANSVAVTGSVDYDEDGPAKIQHQCSELLDCSDFSGSGTITSTFSVLGGSATVSVTGM